MPTHKPRWNYDEYEQHYELMPSDDECDYLVQRVQEIYGIAPPQETFWFFKRLILNTRSEVFNNMSHIKPNLSSVKAALEKSEKLLREVYDIYGNVEPVLDNVKNILGEPQKQLDSVMRRALYGAMSSPDFEKIACNKKPRHDFLKQFSESSGSLLYAIKIAQEQLEADNSLLSGSKTLANIRNKAINRTARVLSEKAKITVTKYESGKFAKLVKSILETAHCVESPINIPNAHQSMEKTLLVALNGDFGESLDFCLATLWGDPTPWEPYLYSSPQ